MATQQADLMALARECGVECEITRAGTGWHVDYDTGESEDYPTFEEACQAIRAMGAR